MIALPAALVLLPLAAAMLLAVTPDWRWASWINLLASVLTLVLAALLAWAPNTGSWFIADPLAVMMALLTATIGCASAWFSLFYIAHEVRTEQLGPGGLRLYHAAFQLLSAGLMATLLAANPGLACVGIEVATLAGISVVGLKRSPMALAAAWQYFLLCGASLAIGIFGTILLFQATGATGWAQLRWGALAVAHGNAGLLNLAFILLVIGYGACAGLVPLHGWVADTHAEGPTPISAILSGSLFSVALSILLRLRAIMAHHHLADGGAMTPGPILLGLGLVSVLLAALCMWQRRSVKRFLAFASIEQNGIVAIAFGLGGPVAIFAGLLHLVLSTLTRTALFICIGRTAQMRGGQRFDQLAGLLGDQRAVALTLAVSTLALVGLAPFGLFSSQFLILRAMAHGPTLLILPLALGLAIGGWALITRLQTLCLGAPATPSPPIGPAMLAPAWLLLALVLLLGLAMPARIADWLHLAAGAYS